MFCVQIKYKEAVKKGETNSLYSTLPETLETQHAKEASQLQSQVSSSENRSQLNISQSLNKLQAKTLPVFTDVYRC